MSHHLPEHHFDHQSQEVQEVIEELGIPSNILTPSEQDLLQRGGYSVSDSGQITDRAFHEDQSELIEMSHRRQYEQEQYDKAGIVVQNMRYQQEVNRLNQENIKISQEVRRLHNQLYDEKMKARTRINDEHQKTQDAMLHVQRTQQKLEQQLPLYQQSLGAQKEELRNLELSQEDYMKLKLIPYEKKTLREFVLGQVHGYVKDLKKEVERCHLGMEDMKRENQLLQRQIGTFEKNQEINELTRGNDQARLKKVLEERDERIRELENEKRKLTGDIRALRDKGNQYDQLQDRLKSMDSANRTMQQQASTQGETIQMLSKERDQHTRISDQLRKEIQLLSSDKTHLSRENLSLLDRNKFLQDRQDQLEKEVSDAKARAEKCLEKLLNSKDVVTGKYEEKFMREMDELRSRHARDLEMAKTTLSDIHEQRVAHLKDCKDELDGRVLKLEQQLKDKTSELDDINIMYRTLQTKFNDEMSGIRLQVRMKSDEVERVRNLYEENLIQLKEAKIENEQLKDRQDVIKSEYYKMESVVRTQSADVKAELEMCKERLKNYESIEKELDRAIMNVAEDDNDEVGNVLLNTIHSAPTTTKRRIQQSLLLAQRLQTKQKENEALRAEIAKLKDQVQKVNEEKMLNQKLIEKANQPYSMLLADIQKSEKEQAEARRRLAKAQKLINQLRTENQNMKGAKNCLEEDLGELAQKRKEIEALQSTLFSLLSHRASGKIDIKELKGQLAESIRHQRLQQPMHQLKLQNAARPKSRSPGQKRAKGVYDKEEVPYWFSHLKENLKTKKVM